MLAMLCGRCSRYKNSEGMVFLLEKWNFLSKLERMI